MVTGTQIQAKFDQEWGAFRQFIAAHPLTGFWVGVAVGAALIFVAGRLF